MLVGVHTKSLNATGLSKADAAEKVCKLSRFLKKYSKKLVLADEKRLLSRFITAIWGGLKGALLNLPSISVRLLLLRSKFVRLLSLQFNAVNSVNAVLEVTSKDANWLLEQYNSINVVFVSWKSKVLFFIYSNV